MISLRLYDSLRRQKVPFEPLEPGKVSMYLCGPTTYAEAHIGHAYSAICFDVVRRALGWLGYQVTYGRNVTDVDDKIINRSNETGEHWLALASRFADAYNRDMETFGIAPPDIEPRVSGTIEEIIALVQTLIDAGKAYAVAGDVYFEVAAFPGYGKLSGMALDELRAGERVEVDTRKRSPADFALWKSAKPGEPSWEAPWGKGRPGWHIECSAMTTKHLGSSFDIHAGGKDLIFPHHENEIAQSQGAFGEDTFARYWMHNGFLNFSGEKMSKSLGNVFGCQQIAAAVGPEAMRFFTVSHHYRSPVNFEVAADAAGHPVFKDLEAVDKRLDYFYTTLKRLDELAATIKDEAPGEVVPEAAALVPAAREALTDDFNSPVVLAALSEAARAANKLIDEPKGVAKDVRRRSIKQLATELRAVGGALGILQSAPVAFLTERRDRLARARGIAAAEVERLIAQRAEARAARDFARADELRAQASALGVEVLDTPRGAEWRVAD
ncbi:MAG TPA: cysteine--tRNA ligase [Kofleriaceae bacterium]|nr:cysteine--tRNA ligase [Kofleriaceae bacterium]